MKQILDRVGLKHVIQDEVILITAAPPADPRPAKPPVNAPGPAALHPPPDERVILDRLEDLGIAADWTRTGWAESFRYCSIQSLKAMKP